MPDEIEIKQVPHRIVKAFTDRYGKIGQQLDENDWLDLFNAWYAGWLAGIVIEREACAAILDNAVEWYSQVPDTENDPHYVLLCMALKNEAQNIRLQKDERGNAECSIDITP